MMATTLKQQGGSTTIRPSSQRLGSTASGWTMLVVAAAIVLSGHIAVSSLLIVAVIAGLPHGATDVLVGRDVLHSFGRSWWKPFLAIYLGLVALVLGAWAVAPALMLAGFLVLSVIHFGGQDAQYERIPASWIAIAAHGGAPIVVSALFHSSEVGRLFAILAGPGATTVEWLIAGPAAFMWMLAVGVTVCRAVRGEGASRSIVDLVLMSVLFAAASPLVAFAFYFALLHTPRALVAQHVRDAAPSVVQGVGLTALAGLLGLCIYHAGQGLAPDADVVRTSFMLLSALTVPHMALEYCRPACLHRKDSSSELHQSRLKYQERS